MNRVKLLPAWVLLIALGLAGACVDHAYDFGRLDGGMVIGGEDLTLPLGSTKKLMVDDLISGSIGDVVKKNDDGTYSIRYEADPLHFDLDALKDIDASLSFGTGEDAPVKLDIDLFDIPKNVVFTGDEEVDLTLYGVPTSVDIDENIFTLDITVKDLPEAIAALDAFTLSDGAQLTVSLAIPKCGLSSGEILPDVSVDLSQLFETTQKDDVMQISNVKLDKANGFTATVPCGLKNIRFNPKNFDAATHTLKLSADVAVYGEVSIENPKTNRAAYQSANKHTQMEIRISLSDTKVKSLTGKFDYSIEDIATSFSLNDMAKALGDDAVIDFMAPEIDLAVRSNVGVPAFATMNLAAIKHQQKVAEIKNLNIPFPVAPSPQQPIMQPYCVAKGAKSTNTTIGIDADIPGLIRQIPETINVDLKASTDKTVSGLIVPGADYFIDVYPKIDIPIAFGASLNISFCDTLKMPETVTSILGNNTLNLLGDITNTLPVTMDFTIVMTNDAGEALTVPASQVIKAGGTSNLDLLVKRTDLLGFKGPITQAILTFRLSAGQENVPVKATDYLQANLHLKLPGGYHIAKLF